MFSFIGLTLSAQENIFYEKVILTDSVGKEIIFSTISEWFASTYNSIDDVIIMADKDAGKIMGKGYMLYKTSLMYLCYEGHISYTIKIYIKDDRYKIILTNFTHRAEHSACELGVLTTSDVYMDKGLSKGKHNKNWTLLKARVEEETDIIFNSVEDKTSQMNNVSADNDW